MELYQVGPDSFQEWDLSYVKQELYEWCVYFYNHYGQYEADGIAVFKRKDGGFEYVLLNHCSCYGPLDCYNSFPHHPITLDEILYPTCIYDLETADVMKEKIKELEHAVV